MKNFSRKKVANGVKFIIIMRLCAPAMRHTHTLLTACFVEVSANTKAHLSTMHVHAKSRRSTETPSPLSGSRSSKWGLRRRDACCPQSICLRESETCFVDSFLEPPENFISWEKKQPQQTNMKNTGPNSCHIKSHCKRRSTRIVGEEHHYRISLDSTGGLSLLICAMHGKFHVPKTTLKRIV